MHFRTRAIHVGQDRDAVTGAVVPPIHVASTFVQPDASMSTAYDYARTGSPTRHAFERTLADLDGGVRALAFASGMAATHCVAQLLVPGDRIVTGTDIYGGTWRLFNRVLAAQGILVTAVDTSDTAAVAAAVVPGTKLVWIESPGNPLLSITDIAACADIAHAAGALLACDATLATPALTRPLEHGADIVMHSATKSIGGHSDLLGGALVVRDAELGTRLHWLQNATGAVMGPLEAFLCSRGLKTLELRVQAQSATALQLAEWLALQPQVRRVLYPGLAGHPGHALAVRQMRGGFGTIVSFEIDGGVEQARRVVESTRLFQLAVSLGAVESLIEIPALMSHGSYDPAARKAVGIADGLIRLAVGLEAFADLRADLASALG
ncbi:MAG: PLP-dependent aspartate aminotransferase family protein [Planctomycetaceae bacterium]|nr:PLP-dependent aspartate aminotransferase family protein [Planctomycetaceae bacterium]